MRQATLRPLLVTGVMERLADGEIRITAWAKSDSGEQMACNIGGMSGALPLPPLGAIVNATSAWWTLSFADPGGLSRLTAVAVDGRVAFGEIVLPAAEDTSRAPAKLPLSGG